MAQRIVYCEVCKSSSNIWRYSICNTCQSRGNNYIRESDHQSEIEAKNSEIRAKNSEIAGKDFEIRNLRSEMSQSEMKANEKLKNLRENLEGQLYEEKKIMAIFAGQLYDEKEFLDVKIVCNEKTLNGHKAVLSCRSEVFKTMIRNKSLTEKQAAVMEINENDFNSETMEQVLFFFYHGNVQDIEMINTDLLRAADKYEVVGLMDICAKYLESNLSLENALDVLVAAELTNRKGLFDSAAKFIRENKGKMNKTGAYKEIHEKDPKFIANVMSKMFDIE